MKKLFLSMSIVGMILSANAQEMPMPSPTGKVMQRVGLTDIDVNYSRPSVKGRTIFGDLVPLDKMWRTGANGSTKITFSTEVTFNGKNIEAGTYSLFTIPGDEWIVVLNKNLNLWGNTGYNQDEDVARSTVKPTTGAFVESMRFTFENISENNATLVLAWADTRISIPIKVETASKKEANIAKALADAGKTYRSAASFYAEKGEYVKALGYIDQAIAADSYWYTKWVKAEILAKSGDTKAALKQGKVALEAGDVHFAKMGNEFTYRPGLEKTMESWKAKK